MRRIRLAGDCGELSANGSGGGVGLSLPVTLSDVDWPLLLWLASVDIGIESLGEAPVRVRRGNSGNW